MEVKEYEPETKSEENWKKNYDKEQRRRQKKRKNLELQKSKSFWSNKSGKF